MYVTEFILCVSIFFLLFTGCIWIIYSFQTRSKKELILTKNYSNMTYQDFFKYIDFLMDMELYFTVELILKGNLTGRVTDFEGLFEAMNGYEVTIRLLDPPLHEFLPKTENEILELATSLNISVEKKYGTDEIVSRETIEGGEKING